MAVTTRQKNSQTPLVVPARDIERQKQPRPSDLLDHVEMLRFDISRKTGTDEKSALGQFLTPKPVAIHMASMFENTGSDIHILDAGAGGGMLSAACVVRLCEQTDRPERITITAYEVDERLSPYLADTMRRCEQVCQNAGIQFAGEVIEKDFIQSAVERLSSDLFSIETPPSFTCAILNPPYRKIHSDSEERKLLRSLGIETSNLYTGFIALATRLLMPDGELVAITPRSFCNGPYFKPFRSEFLSSMRFRHIHLFDSRDDSFPDDNVLQENIIFHAVKNTVREEPVSISANTNVDDGWTTERDVPHEQVVSPADPDAFIHIVPDEMQRRVAEQMSRFSATLDDLGLAVSTGKVVDFRAREYLRDQPDAGTVPLLYPQHLLQGRVIWPKNGRKPNAIQAADAVGESLVPNATYVLIKRFSSKEEKKRIVATVYEAGCLPGDIIGIENHLNYIHQNGAGMDLSLACGLAAFLNTSLVDAYFRQFNGHTQVNATDLRSIRYPSRDQLITFGRKITPALLDQPTLDMMVEQEFFSMTDTPQDNPTIVARRVQEALEVIRALGFPREQQNERSALTLLALLDLKPDHSWEKARNPLCGITPMMDFFAAQYGKQYKPNTRETVRRQTVHQFLEAGLILINPDEPERPTNSPKAVYQIEESALALVRTFGSTEWATHLREYLTSIGTLRKRYARERERARIPVTLASGKTLTLSPGGQNVLVQKLIEDFAPVFTPGGAVLYVGDTDEKFAFFDEQGLAALGVSIESHGKMPDVVIHHTDKNWLVLIEAVTSHGPVNPKRRDELQRLFRNSTAGLVFVTAFLSRRMMVEYLNDISWETEVWVADAPTHLIHFNGDRFLGPYE